jgi:hypothetical protein
MKIVFAVHLKLCSFLPSADFKPNFHPLLHAVPWQCTFVPSLCVFYHPGSAKVNRREPKSCLVQVLPFMLGHLVMHAIARHIQARPNLELKTRPRFCPVSLSLSMHEPYAFVWATLTGLCNP